MLPPRIRRARPPLPVLVTVVLAGAVSVAGCGSSPVASGTSGDSTPGTPSEAPVAGTLTVFAAASLQEAFTTLGEQFEAAHHGVSVRFNFGGSSALAQSILRGAPADVFASASPSNMAQLTDAGLAARPAVFAENAMEIAVPPDNPAGITGVPDLSDESVKVALCQPQVPCGATAAQVFANANVDVRPVTLEVDVKSALTKVQLGEVDAGLVYVTDVRAAGALVKGIPIPADLNASTDYSIAALAEAPNVSAARAFASLVLSSEGARVLTAAGFGEP